MERFFATIDRTLADPSFWIGLIVVFVFAHERFGQKQTDLDDYAVLPVPIRSFTTRFRYNFAAFVYGGVASTTYVALVCLGAYPELQRLIKDWFGAVGAGTDDQFTIATPLGAAVVVTSLLPSIPQVRRWDVAIRAALRDFASIPLKARFMSGLLLDRLGKEVAAARGAVPASDRGAVDDQLALFDRLQDKVDALDRLPRLRAARRYALFFASYASLCNDIKESVETLRKDLAAATDTYNYLHAQLYDINARLAQFIVCAILVVEADEYSAMRTLSHDLKLEGITHTAWRFKSSQILLAIIVVFVCAIAGSVLAALSMTILSVQTPPGILGTFVAVCALFSVSLVPTFVAPLVFAAGAQMYIIDRTQFSDDMEWDERLLSILLTALGCLGTALLVTLVLGVLASHLSGERVELGPMLPWALPPAAVALAFFLLSRLRVTQSRAVNAAVDFASHAAVAVLAALAAQNLSLLAGLRYQGRVDLDLLIYAITEPLPVALMAALVGGALGAFQCAVSRDRPAVPGPP